MGTEGAGVRRPAWAASASFSEAWSKMEQLSVRGTTPNARGSASFILGLLSKARVVVVGKDQADALPPTPVEEESLGKLIDTTGGRMRNMRLPFPIVFVEADGARIRGDKDITSDGDAAYAGTLFFHPARYGSYDVDLSGPGECGVAGLSFYRMVEAGGRMSCAPSFVSYGPPSEDGDEVPLVADLFDMGTSHVHLAQASYGALDLGLVLLEFLQAVNVELVEAPLNASARKKAERKGQQVALTVQVKQSKRRISKPSENRADFSHRFEVRGHYTHHFETKPDGTPNKVFERYARKHPDKVLSVQGEPCVRFWTPPYVKGPIDKPFVPKVRVVEGA